MGHKINQVKLNKNRKSKTIYGQRLIFFIFYFKSNILNARVTSNKKVFSSLETFIEM